MTNQITPSKRIKMAFDGSQMRIACDNGDVLILDTQDGDCYKMRDNQMINIPDDCKHEHTEPYIVDPAGGNVDICLDCGKKIDPEELAFEDAPEVEF